MLLPLRLRSSLTTTRPPADHGHFTPGGEDREGNTAQEDGEEEEEGRREEEEEVEVEVEEEEEAENLIRIHSESNR